VADLTYRGFQAAVAAAAAGQPVEHRGDELGAGGRPVAVAIRHPAAFRSAPVKACGSGKRVGFFAGEVAGQGGGQGVADVSEPVLVGAGEGDVDRGGQRIDRACSPAIAASTDWALSRWG
jgi:hypothetical protein